MMVDEEYLNLFDKPETKACSKCKEDIKYGDMCYTQTYKLKNTSKQFQTSFHINCI